MRVLFDDSSADELDDAHKQHQHEDGDVRDIRHVAVVAVSDGEVAEAARAGDAGHGRKVEQADDGDGRAARDGGDALFEVHAEDDLRGARAHRLRRLDEAAVKLGKGALHLTGEVRH